MPLLAVLGLLCLAIFLIPPLLLRRRAAIRSQEYLVACQPTPVPVIHNAGTGYVLRMSSFALLFTLGARGELWAVIVASVFLGLGFLLVHRNRETLLPFIHTALSRGQSFTLHNFIASRAGDDQRVRLLASGLTLVALSGFVAAEAYGLASFAQPLLPQNPLAAPLLMLVLLLAVAAGTSIAGNSGVLQAAQLQLGLFYFGLFGALALLLYLHVSELAALPPQAILAFPIAAVSCVMISIYRRSKYVDATPLASRQDSDRIPYVPQAARLLRRCEKILNPCISVLAGLIVALALMEIFSLGTAPVLQNNAVALRNGMHLPAMAMISLSMLPLFYPLVDAATWQRLAAAAKNDKNAQPQALRKILLMSAVEAPLLWLLVGMFGALAAAAAHLPAAPDAVTAFIRWLENEENAVSALALRLLSVALLAMTMPAMSAMFSACLCTIRYDLMPALPSLSADEERIMRRRTTACAIALHAAAVTTLLAIAAIVPTNFASIGFLAFLSALATLQLSLAPLLLGGLRAEKTMVAALHPHWALGIIAAGAGCGVLTIVLFFMTGSEPWLWDSIPACLAAGSLLTAVARFSQRSRAG